MIQDLIIKKDRIDSLFHLTLALHHVNKDVESKFKLSLVQLVVLLHLRELPACSPNNLAIAIGIHPSTLTPTLRRLEKKQLIFVTEDPRDSRKKMLALTRRGEDSIKFVHKELKDLFEELEKEEKSYFSESLDYLIKARLKLKSLI